MDSRIEEKKKIREIGFMNLQKQCDTLGLRINVLDWKSECEPEDFALNAYINDGYVGSRYEGRAISLALKGMCLDSQTKFSKLSGTQFDAREDACVGGFGEISLCEKDHLQSIVNEILGISKKQFLENCIEMLRYALVKAWYPDVSLDLLDLIYDTLTKEEWIKLASIQRNGWPDLTLIKNNRLKFVEVKTSDKLHASQIITIPLIIGSINADVSILQLKRNALHTKCAIEEVDSRNVNEVVNDGWLLN